MKRKVFLKRAWSTLAGGMLFSPALVAANRANEIFEAAEIKEFVRTAHVDFNACKKIIEAKPLLLNCTNQNKKGDFETPLGGAAHMGRKDIADLLLSKGARMDLFIHAFLGHADLVRKMIGEYPHLLRAPGPHGFTLLHHAQAGEHQELADWITEAGLTETFFKGAF
ncbi:ankyrin repeat domain-containing protein [Flavilitoribacter nigricans]|uniref:Ankyrin repeat domain-containing protein n=1 Tax=Flavilitoribacter nigricans (strain ATCC 23147 / DSM 23189 / NBRC 102662 / NCIMB 1420 / SS-2) TaxID=1122177 RepID=A0A2D0N4P7_FLAN2|nr:ankyrin repeat domain-containing protein [Flavilitoribacter nigricans]PHN03368.1 hypothetical protein CRP01_27170 [Flavilitoribacter nigricans DSM 23189 = NBRC 102662]